MTTLKLFTDASVNPRTKIGYGACLCIHPEPLSFKSLKTQVKVKRFDQTSSTRLEMQTLIWALASIQSTGRKIVVYTDSQNITGLLARRSRLEQNNYRSKKNRRINNYKLYQAFFRLLDQLDCQFVKMQGHKTASKKDDLDRVFSLVDKASRKALRQENRQSDGNRKPETADRTVEN